MSVGNDGGDDDDDAGAVCASCGSCETSVKVTSANHVNGTVNYTDLPPAGGDHNACWSSWGVHAQAVQPEHWVHNLEHGGVVLLYRGDSSTSSSDLASLQKLVDGRVQALLTPYAQLPTRFAVVSWGHRLLMDCLDSKAMVAFYAEHVDHAPESLTSGPPASCPQ
ncbi:MAG TPA: DUF3105 domain-containing protein [Polyangiales bacterium]